MKQALFNVVAGFWGVRQEQFTFAIVQPTMYLDRPREAVLPGTPAHPAGEYETIQLRWPALAE